MGGARGFVERLRRCGETVLKIIPRGGNRSALLVGGAARFIKGVPEFRQFLFEFRFRRGKAGALLGGGALRFVERLAGLHKPALQMIPRGEERRIFLGRDSPGLGERMLRFRPEPFKFVLLL